ncbi:MAG: hypothetical protein MPN21_19990 [Thermoanaerobaculia bacterium]|nr:hypothetical protein [Thermoanaerobaculia bacterium]
MSPSSQDPAGAESVLSARAETGDAGDPDAPERGETRDRDPQGRALDGTGQQLPMRHAPVIHFRSGDGTEGAESVELPRRYEFRDTEDGRQLVCKEAPGVFVRVERSLVFSEQEARRLGERTILLDGVGAFAPLVDGAAHLYNLDHHEGCLRAFTLASCEQALVLVLKGLELGRGDWSIYANEPDLDTVFAIWTLLNYRRLREFDDEARDRIVPLLRLEGAIDANGFEVAEFCGLPQAALRREKARLDRLMQDELEAKRSGIWSNSDPAEYTLELLCEIDRMVYRPSDFQDFASIEEEYGHVDIGSGKVAVVCRDGAGIYDVEKRLKKVWGDRLGIIALEREAQHYTLRRAAPLSGIDLTGAYERLNVLDPAVDGRPAGKRWGGSEEIGGSPRPDGTGLTPREVGKILKLAFRRVTPVEHLQKALTAVSWALLLLISSAASIVAWRFFEPLDRPTVLGGPIELAVASGVLLLGAAVATLRLSRGWTWVYGWRSPAGRQWWVVALPALLAAAAGGALVPARTDAPLLHAVGAMLAAALAVELCLRGLVHGQLVLDNRLSTTGLSWFVSRPNVVAALLHAALVPILGAVWLPLTSWPVESWLRWPTAAGIAFVCGLLMGSVRERSLSLWPCTLLLFLGALARWLIEPWWLG